MIEPQIDEQGVPLCHDRCTQHDGKRCQLLGMRPSFICEPAVWALIRGKDAARERIAELEAARRRSVKALRRCIDRHGDSTHTCTCGAVKALRVLTSFPAANPWELK